MVRGADQQAQAGGEVQPLRGGRQLQLGHDQYPARVLMRTAVHMRAGAGGLGGLPVEAGLHPLRPRNFDAGDRQIRRVRREGETRVGPEALGELQLARTAVDGLRDQRAIGKTHFDAPLQRSLGRVGPVDAAITADGFDPVEVVGIGDYGRDQVAQYRAVAFHRSIEMAEARQTEGGSRACGGDGGDGFALGHQLGGDGQQTQTLHLPRQMNSTRPVSIKLDQFTPDRLKRLADAKGRTTQWLPRQAVSKYLMCEEAREAFRAAGLQAWDQYQSTGLHVTHDDADDWLARLQADEAAAVPEGHSGRPALAGSLALVSVVVLDLRRSQGGDLAGKIGSRMQEIHDDHLRCILDEYDRMLPRA